MSDCEPGTYSTIMPADYELVSASNPQVRGRNPVCGYDTMGESYYWLGQTPVTPDPEDMRFYQSFLALTQPLLQNGQIKPLPAAVSKNGSGLKGALKGLEEMEEGKVSGEKLVYTPAIAHQKSLLVLLSFFVATYVMSSQAARMEYPATLIR